MPKNRPKTGRKGHASKTSFKPGQSGNPDGRPPLTMADKEFKELCRAKAPDAVKRLEKIALGKGMTAYKANEYLVDRGYGKPKQEQEVSINATGGGLVIMLPPVDREE